MKNPHNNREIRKERYRKGIIHNNNPKPVDDLECGYRELLYYINQTEIGMPLQRYTFAHVKLHGSVRKHFRDYGYRFSVIK